MSSSERVVPGAAWAGRWALGIVLVAAALLVARGVFYTVFGLLLAGQGIGLGEGLVAWQQGSPDVAVDLILANAAAQFIALGGLAWAGTRLTGLGWPGLGLAPTRLAAVAVATLALVGMLPALQAMATALGERLPEAWTAVDAPTDALVQAVLGREGAGALVLALAALALVPAVVEELFFRGVLLRLWQAPAPWVGALASSLVFAAYHGRVAQFVPLVAVGVVLAAIAMRTGRLWPGIAAHAVYNGTLVGVAMTGGRGGLVPEPGALVVGCGLALALVALVRLPGPPTHPSPGGDPSEGDSPVAPPAPSSLSPSASVFAPPHV